MSYKSAKEFTSLMESDDIFRNRVLKMKENNRVNDYLREKGFEFSEREYHHATNEILIRMFQKNIKKLKKADFKKINKKDWIIKNFSAQ